MRDVGPSLIALNQGMSKRSTVSEEGWGFEVMRTLIGVGNTVIDGGFVEISTLRVEKN